MWGVDPGWNNIFMGSTATSHSGPGFKATLTTCTAAKYFQDSHATTSNAKIAKWQAEDPNWRTIIAGLPTAKTASVQSLLVSGC